jgi:hypothetical protein
VGTHATNKNGMAQFILIVTMDETALLHDESLSRSPAIPPKILSKSDFGA